MSDQNQQWHPYQQQASQPSANDPWGVSQPSANQQSASEPYMLGQPSANDPYPTIAKSPYSAQPQQGWEQVAPPAPQASYSGQSSQPWDQQAQAGYPQASQEQVGYGQQVHDPYAAQQGYQQAGYGAQPGYPQQDPYLAQHGYAQQDPYAAQQAGQPVGYGANPYIQQLPAQPQHSDKAGGFGALFSLSFDKPVAAKIGPVLFIIAMVSAGLTALQTIVFPLLDFNSPLHFALGLFAAPVYALLFIGLVRLGIEAVITVNRMAQDSKEIKDLVNRPSEEDPDS